MAQIIVGGETSLSDSESHSDYDEPAKEALRVVYGKLVERLHSSTPLLEDLVGNVILTQAELEETKLQTVNMEKNNKLLTAMMRKREEEIVLFCQLLFKHDQRNCGRILQSSMSPYQTVVNSSSSGLSSVALQPQWQGNGRRGSGVADPRPPFSFIS